MMNAIRFGAITRMSFKNPPQIDWGTASQDAKTLQAAQKLDKDAWNKFQDTVTAHVQQLEVQHQGDANYYAAAMPVDWVGHMLVVDGADFHQFASDVMLMKQRFLSAFTERVTDPAKNGPPQNEDQMAQEPLPRAFNWARPWQTNYRYDDIPGRAESFVKRDYYFNKATQTIDVTI